MPAAEDRVMVKRSAYERIRSSIEESVLHVPGILWSPMLAQPACPGRWASVFLRELVRAFAAPVYRFAPPHAVDAALRWSLTGVAASVPAGVGQPGRGVGQRDVVRPAPLSIFVYFDRAPADLPPWPGQAGRPAAYGKEFVLGFYERPEQGLSSWPLLRIDIASPNDCLDLCETWQVTSGTVSIGGDDRNGAKVESRSIESMGKTYKELFLSAHIPLKRGCSGDEARAFTVAMHDGMRHAFRMVGNRPSDGEGISNDPLYRWGNEVEVLLPSAVIDGADLHADLAGAGVRVATRSVLPEAAAADTGPVGGAVAAPGLFVVRVDGAPVVVLRPDPAAMKACGEGVDVVVDVTTAGKVGFVTSLGLLQAVAVTWPSARRLCSAAGVEVPVAEAVVPSASVAVVSSVVSGSSEHGGISVDVRVESSVEAERSEVASVSEAGNVGPGPAVEFAGEQVDVDGGSLPSSMEGTSSLAVVEAVVEESPIRPEAEEEKLSSVLNSVVVESLPSDPVLAAESSDSTEVGRLSSVSSATDTDDSRLSAELASAESGVAEADRSATELCVAEASAVPCAAIVEVTFGVAADGNDVTGLAGIRFVVGASVPVRDWGGLFDPVAWHKRNLGAPWHAILLAWRAALLGVSGSGVSDRSLPIMLVPRLRDERGLSVVWSWCSGVQSPCLVVPVDFEDGETIRTTWLETEFFTRVDGGEKAVGRFDDRVTPPGGYGVELDQVFVLNVGVVRRALRACGVDALRDLDDGASYRSLAAMHARRVLIVR